MFLDAIQAVAKDNYIVHVYCNDGSIREVDMKPIIAKGGIFEKLKNPEFFRGNITVLNDTVAWDLSGCYDPGNCIDLAPEILEESPIVPEVLS